MPSATSQSRPRNPRPSLEEILAPEKARSKAEDACMRPYELEEALKKARSAFLDAVCEDPRTLNREFHDEINREVNEGMALLELAGEIAEAEIERVSQRARGFRWVAKGILAAPYSRTGEQITLSARTWRRGYTALGNGYVRLVTLGRCVDPEKFHFEVVWQ